MCPVVGVYAFWLREFLTKQPRVNFSRKWNQSIMTQMDVDTITDQTIVSPSDTSYIHKIVVATVNHVIYRIQSIVPIILMN